MKRDRTLHIHVPPSSAAVGARGRSDSAVDRTVRLSPGGDGAAGPPASGSPPVDDLYSLYAVQGKIGDGGMGVVYLARDRRLGRHVAIKRLNQQAQGVTALRHRFLHEARAVATLNHIHIVHIYALGEDSEGPYIVMEYVPGPEAAAGNRPHDPQQPNPPLSLDQQVTRNGQLTVSEAIDLLVKVSKAIAYAHACGVIHRDLKPSNILLDETGEPKIVDFGLARLMRSEESQLTVPGEKLLSLGYGAPEQENDASVSDERADVYGLGALLYFAITGQNPRYFREQDIPVPLRDVLVKALATDREQRWSSASAFLEALQAVQTRTRVETPTAKTTWRCKWCDTVNPLTIRFCSECGWDGGESCPECGAERFVGVQYCGSCGADARTYEGMALLMRRMQAALSSGEFERVISLAGRVTGFEPAGPSGRKLLKDMHDLRDQAQRRLARRDQLKELVPVEMQAENYERARTFIGEYRELCGNTHLLEDEERELPALILKRDLRRARRALRDGEPVYALRLCDELLTHAIPDNPECLALRRAIVRRLRARLTTRALAVAGAAALLYLLSLPPVLMLFRSSAPALVRAFYAPARWTYVASGVAAPLRAYARAWGESDVAARFAPAAAPTVPDAAEDPPELRALADNYARQTRDLAEEERRTSGAWPGQYLNELDTLMERRRALGEYEAWAALQEEQRQFEASGKIGPPRADEFGELQAIKQKYRALLAAARIDACRRLVAATKKYVNDLTDLQRTFTKDARMADAARVNVEIRRVRATPEVAEAEALLADYLPYGESETPSALPPPTVAEEPPAELARLRENYAEQLAAVESAYAQSTETWPDKYLAALKTLMDQFQAGGDYSGWEAAKSEFERFEIDRAIRPQDTVLSPYRLGELQRQHIAMLTDYRATRARGIVKLAEKQVRTLTEQQRRHTMSGDMEAAGRVNAEIRRLRSAPEVLAVQAELAPPPAVTNAPASGPASDGTAE